MSASVFLCFFFLPENDVVLCELFFSVIFDFSSFNINRRNVTPNCYKFNIVYVLLSMPATRSFFFGVELIRYVSCSFTSGFWWNRSLDDWCVILDYWKCLDIVSKVCRKHQISKFSIYRIERVLPFIPWHPRSPYADTKRKACSTFEKLPGFVDHYQV